MSFVQLQVISTNSLMQSTMKVEELVLQAKKQGYQALALTDHNVMYGVIEFYELAKKHGLKPIIGLTLDVESYILKNETYSLVLLAKNYEGYQELIQLSTKYQLEEKPVALTEIIMRSENLFVISPDDPGELRALFETGRIDDAKALSRYLSENLSDFYVGISIQNHNEQYLSLINHLKVPKLALGNVQYLMPEDKIPTKVLRVYYNEMALGEENQAEINQYINAQTEDYSLRPPQEMLTSFNEAGLNDAVQETLRLANEIRLDINLDDHIMPSYKVPRGETSDTYLKKLCHENLNHRVQNVTEEYHQRLNKELDVISTMGFSDYFLIVWDIMYFAHKQNIYTGSGRGSAAGSLVAYLLEITNIDPIEYDLLFERFLNEERFTLPDIDLDFPDNRRDEILTYIHEKYGSENVAQIGTLGSYKAKSAIRDVGRVFGLSSEELSKWSKAIPNDPNTTLKSAVNNNNVRKLIEANSLNQKIFQIAERIEGSYRHTSTHAAAVIISDYPISDHVPLQIGSSDISLTQYTMDAVEKIGLLKLDILALKNLTIMSDCIRYIPFENNGQRIDIDNIPLDDPQTLKIFQEGDTDGIFQFESDGIRQVLRQLKPNSFEDIVAVNALYRPGPMEQIDTFIKRKNGDEPIYYLHDDLSDILEVTYGIMVYQEQVMQVASKMAGYTLNEADILRRDISKKNIETIESGQDAFIAGAQENGYTKETAMTVYGYIKQFAGYGFNRSHAVAYSKLAYQLAYVKAHYPASFYAAVMRSSSTNKIKLYYRDAKQAGVEFLPPHINNSFHTFTIDQGKIRFGFDVIKGLPKNLKQMIISERQNNRPYKDILDFLNRIDINLIREEDMVSLIYSGAFDQLGENRASLIYSLPSVMDSIQMSHGNVELFELFAPSITKKEDFTDEEKMKQEYEMTSFYFTGEPGEKYNKLRDTYPISYIVDANNHKRLTIMGVVEEINRIQTKKGEPMSFIDIIDETGKISLTLFPETHRKYIKEIEERDTIIVEGKYANDKYGEKIIVNKITQAAEVFKEVEENFHHNNSKKLYVRFDSVKNEINKLTALQELLTEYHGNIPVIVYDEETKKQMPFKKQFFAKLSNELLEKLKKLFGNGNIIVK